MKGKIEDLAIFGGEPAFTRKLHVGCPNIGDRRRFLERVNDILDRNWLTNYGPYEQEFEGKIAEMIGVKHCIATCNGTVALEIAIRAVGLRGEVIIPSFTFIATAHALQWQEITPVFCDIDPETYNIDPQKVEKMITPRTSGIIGVHLWGRPCDIDSLTEIARKHNLKLLFDAAHAFGCTYKGRMIGNFGIAEIFSFHATKFLNTFEGGAVVTNDDEIAEKIRLMKNFGFVGYDKVIYVGTNGKMSEISAAMGLTNLESMEEFIATNYRNWETYKHELEDIHGIKLMEYPDNEKSNYQYIVLEVDEDIVGISRDHLVEIFHIENVLARRYFYPGCHCMEPYRSYFPHAGLLLPETEKVAKHIILLPTGTDISKDDIKKICHILRFVIENAQEVRGRLESTKLWAATA